MNKPTQVSDKSSAEAPSDEDVWRDLALQFDNHRMQALGWLRLVAEELPRIPAWSALREFIAAPPLSGVEVLQQRLAALATQQAEPEVPKAVLRAIREAGFTLVQTAQAYHLMRFGEATAQGATQQAEPFDPFAGHVAVLTKQTAYGEATAYIPATPEQQAVQGEPVAGVLTDGNGVRIDATPPATGQVERYPAKSLLVSLLEGWVESFVDCIEGGEADEMVKASRDAIRAARSSERGK